MVASVVSPETSAAMGIETEPAVLGVNVWLLVGDDGVIA